MATRLGEESVVFGTRCGRRYTEGVKRHSSSATSENCCSDLVVGTVYSLTLRLRVEVKRRRGLPPQEELYGDIMSQSMSNVCNKQEVHPVALYQWRAHLVSSQRQQHPRVFSEGHLVFLRCSQSPLNGTTRGHGFTWTKQPAVEYHPSASVARSTTVRKA